MLKQLKPFFDKTHKEDLIDPEQATVSTAIDLDKSTTQVGTKEKTEDANSTDEDVPTPDAQNGIKRVEAITLLWTKKSLITAYGFIFVVYFVNSLQQQIQSSLVAYAISDWESHSLIAAISVVSSILSGVLQIPTASVLDIWGRAEGFAIMVCITTLGLIMMAACQNVETYAAAQVFYGVGFQGMSYVLEVVIADTSSLRNRSIAFAFSSSPYIATAFAGPAAAASFYETAGWRWAYGAFAIITPVMSLPILVILWFHQQKAYKQGLLLREKSGRSVLQSIWHYIIEFDALGVLLLAGGLVLFLLPFSLAGSDSQAWSSPSIIAEIVIGAVLIIAFAFYERFMAPVPYLPFELLTSPSVVGACILSATIFIGYFCWDGYYYSYLQVVHGLSIEEAGYVSNIYSIGSCLWSFVVAIAIRYSGRYKWLAWIALPVQCLGGGLMIHFRQPNTNIGYVVMCQIFIAFSGGTLVICEQMAVMAVAEHGQVAALLALLSLSASIGGGIGSAVSGAIWNNTLLAKLYEFLPADAQEFAIDIFGDLETQLSYPMGDPVRDAINAAYGVTQQRMCIAGTAVLALGFVGVAMWKDVRVKDIKQTKGLVF